MRTLDLSDTDVTGADLKELHALPLTRLNLRYTDVSAAAAERFHADCPQCIVEHESVDEDDWD